MAHKPLTSADYAKLIQSCLDKGISIRMHNHPKTKANWNKEKKK